MQGDQLLLTDLGSSNGTFIGDQKLQSHSPVPLNGPVDVRLGRQTLLKIEPA
jgi:pSer/pThr/pTyr-binding forkhead associated (FHA) protein